jgi:adenosylcobinamide-GDP ribazoletransferase
MIRRLLCAIAFLTRVPVRIAFTGEDVGRATMWFPLVGGLLGLLALAQSHLLGPSLPLPVLAFVIYGVHALATGALHLDGLADMADGFGGGHTRDDVLRIMRDHVIGAYGACALIFVVGISVAALGSVLAQRASHVLVLAPLLARWPGIIVGSLLPYARSEGLGAASGYAGIKEIAVATATAIIAAVMLAGLQGVVFVVAVALASAAQVIWCLRKIGGITGDTLGANVVVCEALVYVLAS